MSLPKPQGWTKVDGSATLEVAPRDELRQLTQHSLYDISQEYSLFSHNLLYCCIPLQGRDPLADFYFSENISEKVTSLALAEPLFVGFERFGHPEYNIQLFAWPRGIFERFRDWFTCLSFIDRASGFYARTGWLEHSVLDRRNAGTLIIPDHTVNITTFAVDSSNGGFLFAGGPDKLQLVTQPTSSTTTKFARNLFNYKEDPFSGSDNL